MTGTGGKHGEIFSDCRETERGTEPCKKFICLSEKGRVSGAKLKPDLVWLRRDAGGQWRKVVADVKVTSTDDMTKAFKEKDEKYKERATKETRERGRLRRQ